MAGNQNVNARKSEHSLSLSGLSWQDWVNEYAIENAEPHWGQPGGSTLRIKHLDNWYVEPALDWNHTQAVVDYWRAHSTDKIVCFSKVCRAAAAGKLPPVNDNSNGNPTETDAEAHMATITDAANIFQNVLQVQADNSSPPTIPFDPNRDALAIGQGGAVTTQTQPNALGLGLMVASIIWILRRLT